MKGVGLMRTFDEEISRHICGNCKYHISECIDDGFACCNPDSESYGLYTDYDDRCEDFTERRHDCAG